MNAAVGAPLKVLLGKLKPRNDDDFVDRLFYIRTPTILFTFALIIGAKQLVGQPIQCWAPKEFKKDWMQYAEGLCFVENTYFVAPDERFPIRAVEREDREIHYYQWVPFVLIGQAMLLMAPKLLWNAFNWKNGLDIRSLIKRAEDLTAEGEFEGKEKAGRELGDIIGQTIEHNQRKQLKSEEWPRRRRNGGGPTMPEYADHEEGPYAPVNFVTIIYLLLKLSNLLMVLVQLHLLTNFLANPNDQSYWGWSVVKDLMASQNWRQSGAFPRETFCDFDVRQPSAHLSPARYTLQCVLMINMFNEKIFLFLWFWLIALAFVGLLNFFVWLHRSLSWASMEQFVLSQLRFTVVNLPYANVFRKFVRRALSRDGVTALRLITLNCEPTMSALLVQHLWTRYMHGIKMRRKKKEVEIVYATGHNQPKMNGTGMGGCGGVGGHPGNIDNNNNNNGTPMHPTPQLQPVLVQFQPHRPLQLNNSKGGTANVNNGNNNINSISVNVPLPTPSVVITGSTPTPTIGNFNHHSINIDDLLMMQNMGGGQPNYLQWQQQQQEQEEEEKERAQQPDDATTTANFVDTLSVMPFVVQMEAATAVQKNVGQQNGIIEGNNRIAL